MTVVTFVTVVTVVTAESDATSTAVMLSRRTVVSQEMTLWLCVLALKMELVRIRKTERVRVRAPMRVRVRVTVQV